MNFDAVVLAGSGKEDWFLTEGVQNKALIPIDGKPMVQYVLEALKGSRYLGQSILVANFDPPPSLSSLIDVLVPAGETLEENVKKGVAQAQGPLVAIFSADIPFLTSRRLDEIIEYCEQNPASIYLPLVLRKDIEEAFPGSKRTYARMKEGELKAGNAFFFQKETWPTVEKFISIATSSRKSIFKIAWAFITLLGWKALPGFLFGKLSVFDLEKRVADYVKMPAKALMIKAPELGEDIDKLDDLILARAILEK